VPVNRYVWGGQVSATAMNCSIDIARLIFGLSSGAALVEVPVLISLANVAFWFQWWYFASGVEHPKAMWVGC